MSREEERAESYRRTAAVIFTVVILAISFLLIRPFLIAILSAAALAYIFYPFYLWLTKRNLPERLASLLTCATIILLVLIPAAVITLILTFEVKSGYQFMQNYLQATGGMLPSMPPVISQWSAYLPPLGEIVNELTGQLIAILQGILKGVPSVVISILVTIFSIYYFLVHSRDLYKFFSDLLPLPEGRYKQIIKRFDDLSRGMIMGQIAVGIIQGILAWIAFVYLQVPNPVLWGFLTAIISIIPLLGAAMVWMPITIYLFIVATATGEYWRAVSLLVYGSFVISLIDNFLKPKIVGDRANIHPLIILFGILGGIQLFGIAGILIGPLVLTIFDLVIEIYKETL